MSIRKARLNGKDVYSDLGEKLRGKNVICTNCGANMHIHKFPEREEYYFALNKGENHTSVCQYYEGDKDAPVITGESPDQLIDLMSTVNKSGGGTGTGGTGGTECTETPEDPKPYVPKKLTKLTQIIKTGVYDEHPFEQTFSGSQYRFIDFVIFDKWARYVWRGSELVPIGARIVDARWIGSFNFGASGCEKIIKDMKLTKEIWFRMFWKVDEKYVSCRFCLDCTSCFGEVKRKIFTSGIAGNGTYNDFVPKKGGKLDVLIATRWAPMNNEQCKEKCSWKKCDDCLGAYWGKCNTAKQTELFPADELTKNKEKKISE